MEIAVAYFDGRSAADRQAALEFGPAGLRLRLDGESRRIVGPEWRLVPPVGKGDWVIESRDGARVVIRDDDAGRLAARHLGHRRLIDRLEASWGWALAALVLAVVSSWALLTYGVPAASRHIAFAIPPEIDRKLSEESIGILDRMLFEPSALAEDRKAEVRRLFEDILRENPEYRHYRIEFRASESIGANAFAIPGGLVIMTDEMVELVTSEAELVSVLAHEVGHLAGRHGLRILLQDSGSAIIIAALTGDLSNITALSATVPTALMQARYSRDFEREADDFAFACLRARGLDTDALSGLLLRLETEQGEVPDGPQSSWFSSHPRSEARRPTGQAP
ncbi:MAG: M48 family metallopeptidase [Woeseiaceae bacterium]